MLRGQFFQVIDPQLMLPRRLLVQGGVTPPRLEPDVVVFEVAILPEDHLWRRQRWRDIRYTGHENEAYYAVRQLLDTL